MKETSQRKRNLFYDAVRGLAILLVVLGHGIQYGYSDFDNNLIFRMIYSFHMPLFMLISGMVVPLGSKVDFNWLKKKFSQLVIPFLMWIILPFLFNENRDWSAFIEKIGNIIQSPDRGGLWFLWVLFLNCCALYMGIKICEKSRVKNEPVVFVCEFAVIFLLSKTVIKWFGMGSCANYCVYYFAGYLLSKYKNQIRISEGFQRGMQIAGILIYILLLPMWHRTQLPVCLGSFETVLPQAVLEVLNMGFKYVTAFCGIAMVFFMIRYFPVKGRNVLAKLGKYTLEVYALHYFFIAMFPFQDNMFGVILNVTVSLLLSLTIAYVVESGRITEILFGKKSGRNR